MAYEPKPGSGSAFKNGKRDKDTQPHWRGDAMMPDGKRYSFAVWEKDGPKGMFLSFKFDDFKQQETHVPKPKPIQNNPAYDEDAPF